MIIPCRRVFEGLVKTASESKKYIFLTDIPFYAENLYAVCDDVLTVYISADDNGYTLESFEAFISDFTKTAYVSDHFYIPICVYKKQNLFLQDVLKRRSCRVSEIGWKVFGSSRVDYYQEHMDELTRAAQNFIDNIRGEPGSPKVDTATEQAKVSKLKWFSDVTPREKQWFWYPYVRLGAITTITAVQATGKSLLICKLAAMASRGKRHELPFHDLWGGYIPFDTEPEVTLYFNAEDDPAEETVYRLKACNADESKIAYIESKDMGINFYSSDIEDFIKESQAKLVVFDPVQQFFTGVDPSGVQLDMNNSSSVRPVMTILKDLARKYECAIVLICHPNKNNFQSALYSTMGSNDFTAAPRSALYLGRNPDDSEQRIIAVTKANSVPDFHQKSLSFLIDFKKGGIVFTGESDLQADDIRESRRSSHKNDEEKPQTQLELAQEIIDATINTGGGYASVKDIEKACTSKDIPQATMYRAKSKMKHIRNRGKGGNSMGAYWYFEGHEPPEQMDLKIETKIVPFKP